MKKITKRIAALGAAVVMMASVSAVSASAYTLRFTSGATSSDNILSFSETVTASNAGKITVNSTEFRTLINGAYVKVECSNFSTNSSNVNSTGKYYLYYSGDTAPKPGIRVTIKGSIKNYSVSKTVSAKGNITA